LFLDFLYIDAAAASITNRVNGDFSFLWENQKFNLPQN